MQGPCCTSLGVCSGQAGQKARGSQGHTRHGQGNPGTQIATPGQSCYQVSSYLLGRRGPLKISMRHQNCRHTYHIFLLGRAEFKDWGASLWKRAVGVGVENLLKGDAQVSSRLHVQPRALGKPSPLREGQRLASARFERQPYLCTHFYSKSF